MVWSLTANRCNIPFWADADALKLYHGDDGNSTNSLKAINCMFVFICIYVFLPGFLSAWYLLGSSYFQRVFIFW